MTGINTGFDPSGAVKPSSIERDVYDAATSSLRHIQIPLNLQERRDYAGRTDGQAVYMGFAARGLAASDTGWLLFKFIFDVNDNMTLKQIAYDSWDNRAGSAVYA